MQLFKRRHPQRGPAPSPALRPLLNGPDVMRRSALGLPLPDRWVGGHGARAGALFLLP